jgi:MFS transporter, DHA3 family, tetracycline resistance protein
MTLDPVRAYLWIRLVSSMALYVSALFLAPHQISNAGLDAFGMILVGVAHQGSILIFEIPTGLIADAFGRKASFSLGFIITGAAFLMVGLIPAMGALIAGSFLWGLGQTLVSGAREAWVIDEAPYHPSSTSPRLASDQETTQDLLLRGAQWSLVGGILGISLAGIGTSSLGLGEIVNFGGVIFILLGFCCFFLLPEKGFRRPKSALEGWKTARMGVRVGWSMASKSGSLLAFLAVTLCLGMSADGFDRISDFTMFGALHWQTSTALPFGLTWAFLPASTLIVAWGLVSFLRALMPGWDQRKSLVVLAGMTVVQFSMILVCAFSGSIVLAYLGTLFARVMRKANSPLLTAWLNSTATSDVRATVLSLEGQMDSIGELLGGPLAGWGAYVGQEPRRGLTVSSLPLLPALWLIGLEAWRSPRKENEAGT